MSFFSKSQNSDSLINKYENIADKLLTSDNKLAIGGYGETHFNQKLSSEFKNNGKLDVHRMVMLIGYNYNNKLSFISEIEYEHVIEVFVEQAFMQYKINKYLNFKAGLLLVPMGIVNEFHEPTTFNGVERPVIDNTISPTTWREVGLGFSGNVVEAKLKYQMYLINGFNGFDGAAKMNGKSAFRSARQKGADSYISSPNFTGKIEFYGIRGLNFGVSGYFGNTQSKLYNGIDKSDKNAISKADSSIVGITMIGFDARYKIKGFEFRAQFYNTSISNAEQYNYFTAKNDSTPNDLGNSMIGYYAEIGYNVFRPLKNIKSELIPFVRYETYNTHNSVGNYLTKNDSYNNNQITFGLTYKLDKGLVLKADMQLNKSKADKESSKTFNAGFGVMF
ncbi:MAG: hypothetical protein A2046_01810 [Bacteroidetes bacterium GWA2_30_7]|nr:MAG: hypothetical protein A2046_01810 [Bacteroidetes bacterium GWA2_30_7]